MSAQCDEVDWIVILSVPFQITSVSVTSDRQAAARPFSTPRHTAHQLARVGEPGLSHTLLEAIRPSVLQTQVRPGG